MDRSGEHMGRHGPVFTLYVQHNGGGEQMRELHHELPTRNGPFSGSAVGFTLSRRLSLNRVFKETRFRFDLREEIGMQVVTFLGPGPLILSICSRWDHVLSHRFKVWA